MKNKRAVIVDDDQFIRVQLRNKLEPYKDQLEIIGDFEHPLEAASFIERTQPDLIFLDIQMPVLNGFELLNKITPRNFQVIFITSFDRYAIQAIRYSALDYLLKPINDEELDSAMRRFLQDNTAPVDEGRVRNLGHNLVAVDQMKIMIPSRTGDHYFLVRDIVRMEADSNYTWIHLSGASKFLASKTLKDFDDLLPDKDFIRAHKSHVVNRNFIESLTSGGELLLQDKSRIPVARRRMNDVRLLLQAS